MDNLRLFCDLLCLPDYAQLQFSQEDIGGTFDLLLAKGILMKGCNATQVDCPCGGDHIADIESFQTHTGENCYYACCRESGCAEPIDIALLRRWYLNERKLADTMSSILLCNKQALEREKGFWKLGKSNRVLSGARREILFSIKPSPSIYAELPPGSTPLLITGCSHPVLDTTYADRTFKMVDILFEENGAFSVDWNQIEEQLGVCTKPKAHKPIPKKQSVHHHEALIRKIMDEEFRTAQNAYYNDVQRRKKPTRIRKPTLKYIADRIKKETREEISDSTISRTISNSSDKKLKEMWKKWDDKVAEYDPELE